MTDAMDAAPALYILGTRGVPASHGGFETFAERFALHLHDRGWRVTVYCQVDDGPDGPVVDEWQGIRRVTFAAGSGAIGTMKFDWSCVRHAMGEQGVMLVLGYNTAVFSALLRLTGHSVLTNMDGIEWKRAKWPWHGRIWLYLNEWIGALTSTKLIADHPEIASHLQRRRTMRDIVMIPYGGDKVVAASTQPLASLGLRPARYLLSIGRIEPENNILLMVRAYMQHPRDLEFVCLGKLTPQTNEYHAQVIEAGGSRVKFLGAIYDTETVKALRHHAAAYCHGHSVGGTNPSLVESMGTGSAIVAHDNCYNRWVAGPRQLYFADEMTCAAMFDQVEAGGPSIRSARDSTKERFDQAFQWQPILDAYEALCASVSARSTGQKSHNGSKHRRWGT